MTTYSIIEEDLSGDSYKIIYFIFPLYFVKNLCLLHHQAIYSEGVSATFMETTLGKKRSLIFRMRGMQIHTLLTNYHSSCIY